MILVYYLRAWSRSGDHEPMSGGVDSARLVETHSGRIDGRRAMPVQQLDARTPFSQCAASVVPLTAGCRWTASHACGRRHTAAQLPDDHRQRPFHT
jgi:hypothetical protein